MPDYKSRTERRRAMNNNKKQASSKSNQKKTVKRIFLSILAVFILCIISGIIAVAAMIHGAPPLKASELKTPVASKIYFKDGSLMTTVGSDDRVYAPINQIPNIVREAFISTEDTRFYSHFGIDPYRIGGAILANFKGGFGSQGGSTITQQVVKNDILTSQKTLTRKVQEAYLAIRLEQKYSKDQILEMYLNTIFLGSHSYGVGTASENYYGISVSKISDKTSKGLAQAAMLAALPKAPSYYDPSSNPTAAKQRRDLVLDLMVKNKVITQDQADAAKKVSIKDMLKTNTTTKKQRNYDAVLNLIESQYVGKGKQISETDFYQGGLAIHTTIDKKVQNTIENALNDDSNFSSAKKNIQAGIASIDTKTGAILGIGGGRHYTNGTNWALAGDTYNGTGNQVGSTAKPLVDYGPAIEYLKWPTTHTLQDEPYKYAGTDLTVGEWDGTYWGNLTMERALAYSRNVPAVKTLNELDNTIGKSKIIAYDKKLGINFNPKTYVESYAIGSFTANPLEIAGAYATYGNNGVYNAPHAITSIDYPDGRKVTLDHDEHVAVHDYTAYMITDMLKDVTQTPTTYSGPSLAGYPIVGKSGSTNVSDDLAKKYHLSSWEVQHGNVDEWFTGYSPTVTTSVWTGYVKPSKPTSSDGIVLTDNATKIASVLFGDVMKAVTSKNTPYWSMPNSVVRASVEKSTGLLASDTTPKSDIITGLYVKGTEPSKVSTKYQKLSPVSSLKASYDDKSNTVQLNWGYNSKQDISYEIDQNTSSGFQPIGTSDQTSFTVNNLQPGTDYEFQVIAIYTDPSDASKNKKSDPVKVTISIPGATPPTPGNNGDNGNNGNGDTGNNGNGNGNDGNNGNGNDNSNGNENNGNGNGNSGTGTGDSNSTGTTGTGTTGTGTTGTSNQTQGTSTQSSSIANDPVGINHADHRP
ncbi:transglycosylase domain-containing protein [Pullulanibacillus sp. KACC 23026]|uniref:penicillin-binding protein 1A n=1 Tax=Pullulanibacillus sp. KACC 23026 TaxID=3028315 RepID=UPI0023B024A0|nr:penicillin-binding protein 1A [Pullulanibacillus sp. KACC 23026]WEG11325.1 transglycosylase domain-containing protein [Pullulanibacillus sp. KACC 23026]